MLNENILIEATLDFETSFNNIMSESISEFYMSKLLNESEGALSSEKSADNSKFFVKAKEAFKALGQKIIEFFNNLSVKIKTVIQREITGYRAVMVTIKKTGSFKAGEYTINDYDFQRLQNADSDISKTLQDILTGKLVTNETVTSLSAEVNKDMKEFVKSPIKVSNEQEILTMIKKCDNIATQAANILIKKQTNKNALLKTIKQGMSAADKKDKATVQKVRSNVTMASRLINLNVLVLHKLINACFKVIMQGQKAFKK